MLLSVLIESDWNLKLKAWTFDMEDSSINRIRLEFKGMLKWKPSGRVPGINRIRLEFKVQPVHAKSGCI